jgi:hypothetical protein
MSADVQVAQLIATGPQDVWLSGDPQVSFFRSMYRRHVPFGMSLEKMNFAQDSVTFDRRGDLITRVFIYPGTIRVTQLHFMIQVILVIWYRPEITP